MRAAPTCWQNLDFRNFPCIVCKNLDYVLEKVEIGVRVLLEKKPKILLTPLPDFFGTLQDPKDGGKLYVSTILDVHKKYNALVLTAFTNDSGFVAALDKACGKFINLNSVTKHANASSKSPELLAKYCDHLLKKSARNPEEVELEDTLNQVVS